MDSTQFAIGDVIKIKDTGVKCGGSADLTWARILGYEVVSHDMYTPENYKVLYIGDNLNLSDKPLRAVVQHLSTNYIFVVAFSSQYLSDLNYELVERAKRVNKAEKLRTFRLLKATPQLKKGAIVQQISSGVKCEYESIDEKYRVFKDWEKLGLDPEVTFTADEVEKQPAWFKELFPLDDGFLTKEELDLWKQFKKDNKA